MILVISFLILVMYSGCYWLIKEYRNTIDELEDELTFIKTELTSEIERSKSNIMANEKMIQWLYDQIVKTNVKKEKQQKEDKR